MGNTRNTGYLQNTIKVSDAGAISFMSGSTMLATINTTGQMSGSSPVLFASTASFVANAQTASFVALAQTASFVANAQSASNAVSAQTSSFANAFTVANTLTAQTLVVQTITSSVDFVTGSTRFGSIADNTHIFTGSVYMNSGGLFVSSSGLTGIGTTNPTATLHVGGNLLISSPNTSVSLTMPDTYGNPSIQLVADNPGVGNMIVNNWGNSQNPGLVVGTTRTDGFAFQVANSISLTSGLPATTGSIIFAVLGNGNVGIGTTTPSTPLQVYSNVASTSNITSEFYNGDYASGTRNFIRVRNGINIGATQSSYFGQGQDGKTYIISNDFTKNHIVINSANDNVGIGTNAPAGKLDVYAGSYQNLIFKAESANQSSLRFNESTNGPRLYSDAATEEFRMQQSYTSTGFLTFYTGPTERMRISSTGNITCTNNSVKRATLTKLASIGSSSSGNISFNVINELGTPGAGYIMVEISAICYGGAGSNGMVYKAIAGGYSGHTINSSYHRYSEYVKIITNGSVDIYNPSYDVYGISVTNGAGNAINIILRLDVTWYG